MLPTPPPSPSNLTATGVSKTQVNLAWNDNSTNETGFVIERCRNANCRDAVEVGQTGANSTAFLNKGLFANTQYTYRVRAVNNVGYSAYSNTITARTLRR